jgi:hypothetical protein
MLRRPLLFLLLVFSSLPALAQNERHFIFHYTFTVKNVSHGERMRVWIPLAHSDTFQEVRVNSESGDLPLKQVQQPKYGNEVLYAEASKTDPDCAFAFWRKSKTLLHFEAEQSVLCSPVC